ncbi:anti-sigma-K factor RskA [Fluviicoccus keumensis]|uniref:Anti-sigma-K factor RskA n=1 Tax=Fluviicoccus keumensis TaxID=1435465 RepID=A0A4Q7Z9Y1_9GAMM|nr:anti-sigma factor [Fluviicoccus keumensis]RZU46874.1 anti-sigma-K factor RskA [Fluviicoccus keumensis]
MKYDHPELRHRLAAEYVLGTLQGKARDRFIALMAKDPEWQRITRAWETRLNPWANALPPHAPPEQVWANIRARVGGDFEPEPFFSLAFWRGWAFGATAAALMLLTFVVLRPAPAPLLELAVISTPEGKPNWLVRLDEPHQRLSIATLFPVAVDKDKALELWAIPDGKAPVSLGLLRMNGKTAEVELSDQGVQRLAMAGTLAISVEPSGGSPTGLPTGPVIGSGKPVLKI